MSQLKEYIIALTNLYGVVHKEKVLEIYNSQNKDKVSLKEIEAMLKNLPVDLEAFAVYTEGAYFIHEAIFMNDNLEDMLKKQKGKPHYIPHKEELLKYMDEEHFEKTGEYKALVNYVKKNFLKNQREGAEELCEEIHKILHVALDIEEVMNTLNYWGIDFKDMDQLNELTGLLMKFANNIRIWENNGHTPREIFEKFEKPNMNPLPKEPFDFKNLGKEAKGHGHGVNNNGGHGDGSVKTKKVGRNEPCPCRSGKKYKKCCGKHEKVISLFSEEITSEEALEVQRLFEIYSDPKVAKIKGKMHEKFHTYHLPWPNQKTAEYLISEWVIMDYPYKGEKTLFDLFLKDMEGKMDRRLLRKLKSWKKTYLSAYEVIDEGDGGEIVVKDIFSHEVRVIDIVLFDNRPQIGEMMVTRLIPVEGKYKFFYGTYYFPLEFKYTMVPLLEGIKSKYNKTWEEFLRENGEELIQLVVDIFHQEEESDQEMEDHWEDSEIPDFMSEDSKVVEVILGQDWKKDIYRKEAILFIEKSRGIYYPGDIINGLYKWWEYTCLKPPSYRKSGVWAAALSEFVDEVYGYYYYANRSEIADAYGVSNTSVAKNFYRLWDFFQHHHPFLISTPDTEGSIEKLKRILKSGDIHGIGEGLEDVPKEDASNFGKGEAQDLIYDAWEAQSPKEKIRLAKKALTIDPDSTDAYNLLAEYQAANTKEAIAYYQKGIEAGEKTLGKAFFKENEGQFWGILETRPYMRAKAGLGMSLLEDKAYSDAVEVFEDMLRLNPNDNQGIRSPLVIAYFMEKDYGKAKALLEDFDEDFLGGWSYNKALQVFAEEGESQEAKRRLKNAIKKNPHVPKYLLGAKRLPETLPEAYSLGGEEEAIIYAIYGKKAWLKTPGAVAWLHKNIKR